MLVAAEPTVEDRHHLRLVMRFGCVFPLPHAVDTPKADEYISALHAALETDTRVSSIASVDDPRFSSMFPRYIFGVPELSEDSDALLAASQESNRVPVFTEPLFFTVQVPLKNQVREWGEDSEWFDRPPSTDYLVAWDGSIFAVGWITEDDPDDLNSDGGYIVRTILEEAIVSAGFNFKIQFPHLTHEAVVVAADPTASSTVLSPVPDARPRLHLLTLPAEFDATRFFRFTFSFLGKQLSDLYEVTSAYCQFQIQEHVFSGDLRSLLKLNSDRSALRADSVLRSARERWRWRHWRRQSRHLIARFWLAYSVADESKREILSRIAFLREQLEETGQSMVFFGSIDECRRMVSEFDARSSSTLVEQTALSMQSLSLVRATVAASLIGVTLGAAGAALIAVLLK